MKDIIEKLKEAGLKGRGGAGFPTATKWELVKKAKGENKYVVCNASEGEPDVFKDGYIIENHPEDLVNGIDIAMKAVGAGTGYIYINKDYYKKFKNVLIAAIGDRNIILFEKKARYIGGEETAAVESIEGKRAEPRKRPPFLTDYGLFGCPTLMNNVETFYYASKIDKGEYEKTRFYSVNGDVSNPGVFELPEDMTTFQVLRKTENYPSADFFVQVGGGASGEIMLPEELNRPVTGAGSITVYDKEKTDVFALMKKWAEFFHVGNCDKCVPCREGAFRIYEMVKKKKLDYEVLDNLFFTLKESSFCA
ncbi:MAG: NADH-ubiquinone oxidoreductase-F iron-sulfur binding region domain-containing protein, partial [Candidatus Pacebacteria bacterium]|nr:NADH-ubiquinone oxidoreductase-F iron-sulfur binding region domain-containing protein [Candidatus Paceibacterota bacterium]